MPNTYTHAVKHLLRMHDFSEDLHLHSCRHSAITLAIENGKPIREVQKNVDHSGVQVTEQYAHDEYKKKALKLGLE